MEVRRSLLNDSKALQSDSTDHRPIALFLKIKSEETTSTSCGRACLEQAAMQLYADSFKYQDLLCSHEQCQKKLFVAPYTLPQLV